MSGDRCRTFGSRCTLDAKHEGEHRFTIAVGERDTLVAQRDALAEALRRMLDVYAALMPGIKHISVQDYAELNDAPIAARAALKLVDK